MTSQEFNAGWKLLILQPWGWRYRSLTADGRPSEESRTQLEFYFTKLSFGHPEAWMKVAELYAQGAEWPSLMTLKTALLQLQSQYVKGITDARTDRHIPMPEEVRAMLDKINAGKEMPA